MLKALYDGNCLICRSSCETMCALDWLGRIEFVGLARQRVVARLLPTVAN